MVFLINVHKGDTLTKNYMFSTIVVPWCVLKWFGVQFTVVHQFIQSFIIFYNLIFLICIIFL